MATIIDVSRLPAPNVVEPLDFEAIYQEQLADFRAPMKSTISKSCAWSCPRKLFSAFAKPSFTLNRKRQKTF